MIKHEADSINIEEAKEDMFAYWLSVITEKEIVNKDIIENARKEKEVIQMAVSAIARQTTCRKGRSRKRAATTTNSRHASQPKLIKGFPFSKKAHKIGIYTP